MGKIGNLWFDVNLRDATDKDYESIRKKIRAAFKEPIEVDTKITLKVPPEIGNTFRKPREEADKLLQSVYRVQSALDRLATVESRIKMGMNFGGGGEGYAKALRQISELREALNSLDRNDAAAVSNATGSGFTRQLNEIRLLAQEQDKLNKAARRAAAEQERERRQEIAGQQRVNDLVRRTTEEYRRQGAAVGNLGSLVRNYLSVYAAGRFLQEIITIGGEFEKQKIALRSILGEASKAESIFSQIKTLAVESPFEFKELASYTKQLSAFSIPYEELFDTTKRLADISAGLGVDMGRIILAYGQVRSAAFLRGQELRQFTEAGIPLVDELANKFSQLEGRVVSAGEVFDRISRRMVSFEMVKDVLWSLTSEGGKFFNMQAELAESLAGKWSNLRDSFDVMLSEIAEGANGPLKGTLELLTSLMNNWERVAVVLGGLVTIYGSYRAALVITNALTAASIIDKKGLATAATIAAAALNREAGAINVVNASSARMITRLNGLKGALAGIGKGGGIGIAVGMLAAVAMYIRDSARAANELRDALDDVGDRARSSADVEIARYRQLAEKIEEAGAGTKERADLIAETNQRYGNYLGNLLSEADANEKVRASIDSVTEAIRRRQQAEAYEEGVSKINEKYSGELNDLRDRFEKMMSVGAGRMEKGMAKSFTADVFARLESGMSGDEILQTVKDVLGMYGRKNDFLVYALETDLKNGHNELLDYVELLGEMEEAMKNWGDSMDSRFAGIEFYADRIREIEQAYEELGKKMENTPEAQRGVKLAMYEEMLGVFPQETDDKYINDYKAKIKREIEELMKEIPGWVKKAEEAGRSDTVLSTLIPREDEREDVLKYIERVAKEYKEAEAEIAKRGSFNVEDPGNRRELEVARRQLEGIRALGKELGVDWSLFGESKRTEGDSATEALKERLRLIKEAMSLYERFLSLEGETGASERVKGVFSGLFSGGFSAEEYRKALADIEKEAFKLPAGKGRTGLLSETGKLRLEIDENELRDGMNRAVEVIEATRENWDLYSDLSKGGMDKERAMAIAFGGKVDFKDLAEELREQLRKELKGGMAVDDILGMGESEVKARFGEDSAIGKYYSAIKEEEKKAREASAETISETLAKYKGYFEQRSEMEKKLAEERKTLEENGASGEKMEEFEYQAEEALAKIDENFAMRSAEFRRWTTQVADMGIKALKQELDKAEEELERMEQENPGDPNMPVAKAKVGVLRKEIEDYQPGDVDKDWQKLYKTLQKVGSEFEELGGRIGGAAGEAISAAGNIASSVLVIGNGIKTMAAGIKALEMSSVILTIISAALSIGQAIAGLFKGESDAERLSRVTDNMVEQNEVLNRIIERRIDLIKEATAAEADMLAAETKKTLEAQKQIIDTGFSQLLGNELLGKKGKNNDLDVRELGIGSVEELRDFLLGGETYSPELGRIVTLQQLMQEGYGVTDPDKWNQWVEQLEAVEQGYLDVADAEKEAQAGLSFEDMDSSFMDSIMDMDKSWADMCGDWEDTLRNAILKALVTKQFEGRIQSLYDKMAEYGKDDRFSDTEVGDLASEGEEILKDAYELRERLMEELGLDNYTGSANSLSKSASSITEDQADLLASYVNAMRADLSVVRTLWERYMELFSENGNRIAEQQLERLSRIADNTERNAEAAEAIRELLGRVTTSGSGVKVNV